MPDRTVRLGILVVIAVLFIKGGAILAKAVWNIGQGEASVLQIDRTPLVTLQITGSLRDLVMARLPPRPAVVSEMSLLFVISVEDITNCENLAYQIRSVVAEARALNWSVYGVVSSDSAELSTWIKREHISVDTLLFLSRDSVAADVPRLPTPAVLAVDGNGRITRGVAHPIAVQNVRTVSFVEELGF